MQTVVSESEGEDLEHQNKVWYSMDKRETRLQIDP